jgi:hypothetical protein
MFGKRFGGGRRVAAREKLPLPAVVSTIENSIVAELVDLSSTGARLRGEDLPTAGTLLCLMLDCVRAFGCVAWSTDDECGVSFEEPLANFELSRLRREVTLASLVWRNVDERLAARDWQYMTATCRGQSPENEPFKMRTVDGRWECSCPNQGCMRCVAACSL